MEKKSKGFGDFSRFTDTRREMTQNRFLTDVYCGDQSLFC